MRPEKLRNLFEGHDVRTVPEMGWASKRNSELLQLATGRFDALVTVDRGFASQQDLSAFPIIVLLLTASSNRLADLLPLIPQIQSLLSNAQPGELIRVGA